MNHAANISARIDESLAIPLYHQVYLVLKENIRAGEYPPDTPLPAEATLCDQFSVSRITIKRAMRELVDDGLVVRQRGRGTFVADSIQPPRTPNALDDLMQSVQAIGDATEVRNVSADFVIPPQDIARALRVKDGEKVLRSNQVRLADGDPLAAIAAYVPEHVAAQLSADTENLPMLMRLRQAGIEVARADQEVTATLAEPAVAVQLGIEVGSPLLRLTRLVMDKGGVPVEWLVSHYRGDRYAMRTSLTHETVGRSSAWKTAAE